MNLEFKELLASSGWTQAEAGRRLEMTRGGINHILAGRGKVTLATLKLFKLILASENPAAISAMGMELREAHERHEPWAEELVDRLRRLRPEDRERVLTVLDSVMRAFPDRKVVYKITRPKNGQ